MWIRAQTLNNKPAAVSAAPIQYGHAVNGRKRSPRMGTGFRGTHSRTPTSTSGMTCESRDQRGSRRVVTLTLRDSTHQYTAQLSHKMAKRWRYGTLTAI